MHLVTGFRNLSQQFKNTPHQPIVPWRLALHVKKTALLEPSYFTQTTIPGRSSTTRFAKSLINPTSSIDKSFLRGKSPFHLTREAQAQPWPEPHHASSSYCMPTTFACLTSRVWEDGGLEFPTLPRDLRVEFSRVGCSGSFVNIRSGSAVDSSTRPLSAKRTAVTPLRTCILVIATMCRARRKIDVMFFFLVCLVSEMLGNKMQDSDVNLICLFIYISQY